MGSKNKVHIEHVINYNTENIVPAIERIFNQFGDLDFNGKKIVIKPNLLLARKPENCSTTHPSVIAAVAKEVIKRGGKVVIAESGGGVYTASALKSLYKTTGMTEAAEISGAELNYDTGSSEIDYPEAKIKNKFLLLNPIKDADIIISVSKLKTHRFMKMTAAVKNLYGTIPGLVKAAYHSEFKTKDKFAAMLVDLCEAVHPDISIIDGIIGMEGEGPSGGSPKKSEVLIASVNPYAADLVACRIMGLKWNEAPVMKEAVLRSLINQNLELLEITGENIENVLSDYEFPDELFGFIAKLPGFLRYPVEMRRKPYPYISNRCILCGKCAETCPQHIISKGQKQYNVDISKCIRCYCCHEMCPVKAIDMIGKKQYPADRQR